jgi:Protein of unknown function (DUF3800)
VSLVIYLDESGDLGWTFTAPYRSGGSSRYLTIAAVCLPSEKRHLPKRVVKDLHKKFRWHINREVKWVDMSAVEKTQFARSADAMCQRNLDISLHGIVVQKQNVSEQVRQDSDKLYNYMIRLSLLDRMASHDVVTLVPDRRSIKASGENNLRDYLQTELWFTANSNTKLASEPVESKNSRGVQFADMLSGLIQSRFEDHEQGEFEMLSHRIRLSRLFF